MSSVANGTDSHFFFVFGHLLRTFLLCLLFVLFSFSSFVYHFSLAQGMGSVCSMSQFLGHTVCPSSCLDRYITSINNVSWYLGLGHRCAHIWWEDPSRNCRTYWHERLLVCIIWSDIIYGPVFFNKRPRWKSVFWLHEVELVIQLHSKHVIHAKNRHQYKFCV